jgi:hypothetical protein
VDEHLRRQPREPTPVAFRFQLSLRVEVHCQRELSPKRRSILRALNQPPDFQLTPAKSLERIAPKLGFHAIHFDSRPEFGKKYWLRATNEIAVRAFFSDSFVDHLLAADPNSLWYVEKSGHWLLVYRHEVLFAPRQIPAFMQESQSIAGLFLAP